jgi:hypothetical protein
VRGAWLALFVAGTVKVVLKEYWTTALIEALWSREVETTHEFSDVLASYAISTRQRIF